MRTVVASRMPAILMRVLHVINSLSGSGGAEQGMVREITRFGPDVSQRVVCLYQEEDLGPRLDVAGIGHQTLGLDSGRSGWNWPAASNRLRRIISDFRPDVVHTSLFSGNFAGQLATAGSRVPVLSTFTLSGEPHLLRGLQPGASSWRAATIRRAASVAARGSNIWFRSLTQDALVTNAALLGVDESRGVVIPRGVTGSPEGASNLSRKELGLPEDVAIILNVGRQTAQKGHVHLIEAFRRVRLEIPAHLVILGRVADATSVLEAAIEEAEVGEAVSVVEYTDRASDYYAIADVFAFPSLMEGLGTAVLESISNRLPVVAFDIPPVREITDDGRVAVLVEVGDDARLADELLDVLRTRPVTQVAEAFEWAQDQFSAEDIAGQVEGLLRSVASGQGVSEYDR